MNYLPFLIFIVVIVGLLAFSSRARRRQAAAQSERAERITVGTDVMTTSGLHGTVVAKNPDGTVSLSIAPGVEVLWEVSALRDAASLPPQFQRGTGIYDGPQAEQTEPPEVTEPAGTDSSVVDLGKSEHKGTEH